MATHAKDSDIQDRLFRHIDKHGFGMLGLVGAELQHPQPMTAFVEQDSKELWFFTRNDTDLARAVEGGSDRGIFVFVDNDHDIWASIVGELSEARDQVRMEKYWGPIVAAWYPDGKDDPSLTMLRFRMHEAQVWVQKAGPVKFGWEIAKANLSKDTPDLGERATLTF